MVEEDRVENMEKDGCRSLWQKLQGTVRDTVRARSIADLKAPDGFLHLLMVG